MDRRSALQTMGLAGAGLLVNSGTARAAEHEVHGDLTAAAGPLGGSHAHFCGIHVAKCNRNLQLIAQHYCTAHKGHAHGSDLFQCLLFDSTHPNAKLLGVEYIVSDEQYRSLPDEEKKYWHPHTYEVLAGGLIAPEMSAEEEMAFMKQVLTTWGKTWHTWPDPSTSVPLGEPLLMWALSADDQPDPAVIRARDRQFNVSIGEIRARRVREIGFEVPQTPFPQSVNEVGRQWTAYGVDAPTAVKRGFAVGTAPD